MSPPATKIGLDRPWSRARASFLRADAAPLPRRPDVAPLPLTPEFSLCMMRWSNRRCYLLPDRRDAPLCASIEKIRDETRVAHPPPPGYIPETTHGVRASDSDLRARSRAWTVIPRSGIRTLCVPPFVPHPGATFNRVFSEFTGRRGTFNRSTATGMIPGPVALDTLQAPILHIAGACHRWPEPGGTISHHGYWPTGAWRPKPMSSM